MTEHLLVRRASRATSLSLLLTAILGACDAAGDAPTAIASSPMPTASVDAVDDQSANLRPGEYMYRGCFTEARMSPYGSGTVRFDPPVCIPVALVILESGFWYLYDPPFTPPEYPDLTIWLGDMWSGVSRNGKCRHTGDGSGRGCVSETRYARSMIFGTSMVDMDIDGIWYRATGGITLTFSPGKP